MQSQNHSAKHSLVSPEEEWWMALISGDRTGLKSLYAHYIHELHRYGMALHPNKSLVKDCVQDVFVSLWKYRSNLKGGVNVKLYLFKSLGNRIQQELAKERKRYHADSAEHFEYLLLSDSFEQKMIKEQHLSLLKKKLASSMEALPVRQREVITLLFFENLTYEKVSEIMGINLRSVYTLAWKAISSLKKSMMVVSFIILSLF
ncbi:sigma-70 family RNA polymerase sigma factor [Echinicola sediminis]